MNKAIDVRDSSDVMGRVSQVPRQRVLVNAYRLGGLIAQVGESDADRLELCAHVGRLVAAGSDTPGCIECRSSEDALSEIYALMLETIHARDTLTLEQQLEALSVHIGAIIASGFPAADERGTVLRQVEARLSRACSATLRILEKGVV